MPLSGHMCPDAHSKPDSPAQPCLVLITCSALARTLCPPPSLSPLSAPQEHAAGRFRNPGDWALVVRWLWSCGHFHSFGGHSPCSAFQLAGPHFKC